MGYHLSHMKSIGAWVEPEVVQYVNQLQADRGLSTRSDAIRTILREHADNTREES
jgi:metal-responsive CopG/Arc/MetJ family transcriptional regulator